MLKLIFNILKIFLIMIILDIPYLYSDFAGYKGMISDIQGSDIKVKLIPAIITYLIMAFALYNFVIKNMNLDFRNKIISAALLGFVIYGVYDFTNMATIEKWKYKQSIIDLIWGSILFALSAIIYEKILV